MGRPRQWATFMKEGFNDISAATHSDGFFRIPVL